MYLENGNVHRSVLKNKTATMFFSKKNFSSLQCLVYSIKNVGNRPKGS